MKSAVISVALQLIQDNGVAFDGLGCKGTSE